VPIVHSDDSMERIGEHEAGEASIDVSNSIKEQAQRYYDNRGNNLQQEAPQR